ncbi:MAG: amidohydrolase family protein [Rhodobacteraceae bacterium]|nr:amidohydrolase family protein [Paracoccaceae bacterium]
MSFDLALRGVNLPTGETGVDIGVKDGLIAEIGHQLGPAAQDIDAAGRLATTPFVDAHFHLDATLSLGMNGERNESGTLAEGIALWGRMAPGITAENYRERAMRYCDIAVSQGLLAIRTHVDVTDRELLAARTLAEVKREVVPYLDLQLVAFPQMGFFCREDMADSIREALAFGVDVVGGAPHLERTAELGRASITALCEIAAEAGAMVDMHCDENDDPQSRHIEALTYETQRFGLQGRVVGSHLTSMHSMDNAYAARLIRLMAEAEMQVVVNPAVNMHLQGRYDDYPKRRGLARVPELLAAGCRVAFAQDCVLDPWYPLGRADLLDITWLAAHACHLTDTTGLAASFDAVTRAPAELMGLDHFGLRPSASADLVVLAAADPLEAIRLRPARTHVIRRGVVIAETPAARSALSLPNRPSALNPAVDFKISGA